ncbi:hypothetical protein KAQ01_001352 [Salmonella enterica subsp. enterica serovar Ouakam]|nr:hypothetical protein [Salmonella enterica subsp. enterica serovar Ouakam]EIE1665870.1 hypothetical protein [Salmonella enterica]
MPDGGVNVLSGLHDPLFPRHFFEIHHKIIAFRRQKTTRHWLFLLAARRFKTLTVLANLHFIA